MNRYKHLVFSEREEISRLLAVGISQRSIGQALGRSPSSVSRELSRNRVLPIFYRALPAHQRAARLVHCPRRKRKLDQYPALKEDVLRLLRLRWSPQQIAKWLSMSYLKDSTMNISHESIYQYLYILGRGELKKELTRYLRRPRETRLKKKARLKPRGPIQDFFSIEERPKEVADRIIPGHWEGDLLVGKRSASALGTLVERTTRFTILVPLKARDAESVRHAFAQELRFLPRELKKTLTYDQGQEMAHHKLFTQETDIQVYFAHPHSPWERGTNENTNGLLRQFFPKGTDFKKLTREEIKYYQEMFNGRPRKTLNWRAPSEVFGELLH